MTYEEAREELTCKICCEKPIQHFCRDNCMHSAEHCAVAMASIAIEKQIAVKPLPYKGYDGQCPDCKVIFLDRATNYCGNCGKKIDWEEE